MEPATRRAVETALARGLAQLDLAQRTGETGGPGTWFSGSALERARRAPDGEGATTWSAHELEAGFYSDDGSILTLTTRIVPGGARRCAGRRHHGPAATHVDERAADGLARPFLDACLQMELP